MSEAETPTDETATTSIESDLHPKHRQALLDAHEKATWLCNTLADTPYIEVPSHLRSIRSSLRTVLTEQGLLEHHFVCEQCGYSDWRSTTVHSTGTCPDCDGPLERASTRTPSTDE